NNPAMRSACRRRGRRWSGRRVAANLKLQREAGAAAAGRLGLRIVDLERSADQIVDIIDLGAGKETERNLVDQHGRAVARQHDVVVGLGAFDVELVLEAGAAAALYADAQHRA